MKPSPERSGGSNNSGAAIDPDECPGGEGISGYPGRKLGGVSFYEF